MSSDAKLGTVPKGDEGRDAVHIAIVPVCASNQLTSGSPVKINAKHEAEVCCVEDAIGVVDPFRLQEQRIVPKGAWFWLCLYPKTITKLKHVWEHPSFPPVGVLVSLETATDDKLASETWLKTYIRQHCPYWKDVPNGGYGEFLRYVKDERWIYYYGSDCHSLACVDDADELFRHLSIVLDKRIDASYFEAFTCSC